MRRQSVLISFLLLLPAALCTQHIPRNLVYLTNGSVLFGRIADTANTQAELRLENGKTATVPLSMITRTRSVTPRERAQLEEQLFSPTGAGFLSLFINGAGEFYTGQYWEGIAHLAVQGGLLALYMNGVSKGPAHDSQETLAVMGWLIFKLFSMKSAYSSAQEQNAGIINKYFFVRGDPQEDGMSFRFGAVPFYDGFAASLSIRW